MIKISIKNIVRKIREIPKNLLSLNLLILILAGALFIRIYRIDDLLGFYYDQGRDALVIWKLWHEAKPFLIGPVTGLHGIFLGPLYYYLIAPFYLIGNGSPVFPAVFLAFLSVLAIAVVYILGCEMHSRTAGLIAAVISSFSYYIVVASRWLANPTPILLTSVLLLFSMWKIISLSRKSDLWWVLIALLVGLSLQFESASAVFYVPAVVIFIIWLSLRPDFRKQSKLPSIKYASISLGVFLVTLIPQIFFNFRHDNILVNNFLSLFVGEKAFRGITMFVFEERVKYFWSVFSSKLYAGGERYAVIFSALSAAALWVKRKSLKKGLLSLFAIFILPSIFGYTFFQGNFGHIYDYYMSGYYLPLLLLFSIGLAEVAKTRMLKLTLIVFFITFFQLNWTLVKNMLRNPMDGPTDIKFGSQIRAVNWVFENAAGKGNFNVDIYVPPVIPYSYDYLFLWQGDKLCGDNLCGKVDYPTSLVYLLYEQDPPNPDRLKAWLSNYVGNTSTVEEARFGGITVERRIRQ